MLIPKKRKNKLLELLKVNVTSQNFRRSSIQNSQPATERLLNIAPSVISNSSGNKTESENDQDYDVYVDISELENKPSPIESSPTIYESFEDLYEGPLQYQNAYFMQNILIYHVTILMPNNEIWSHKRISIERTWWTKNQATSNCSTCTKVIHTAFVPKTLQHFTVVLLKVC